MNVYYLTTVHKGHVSLTSVMAYNVTEAAAKVFPVFETMLSLEKTWGINCDYRENNVVVWSLIPEEFKATLIKA